MRRSDKLKRTIDELSEVDGRSRQALAVQYDIDKDAAPKIVAAGKGVMADEILRLAEENRVPLFEDPTLADLLGKLSINKEIPKVLFPLVAEVLAFVYQLDRMAKKRQSLRKHYKKQPKKS